MPTRGVYVRHARERYNRGVTHIRECGTKPGEDSNKQTAKRRRNKGITRVGTEGGAAQPSCALASMYVGVTESNPVQRCAGTERRDGVERPKDTQGAARTGSSQAALPRSTKSDRGRGGGLVQRKHFPECIQLPFLLNFLIPIPILCASKSTRSHPRCCVSASYFSGSSSSDNTQRNKHNEPQENTHNTASKSTGKRSGMQKARHALVQTSARA